MMDLVFVNLCNSRTWQNVTFPKRPVVFIKIVGTHNTANEVSIAVSVNLTYFLISRQDQNISKTCCY